MAGTLAGIDREARDERVVDNVALPNDTVGRSEEYAGLPFAHRVCHNGERTPVLHGRVLTLAVGNDRIGPIHLEEVAQHVGTLVLVGVGLPERTNAT